MAEGSTLHKSVYFPNLNSIRFIAAFMVVIHHMEEIKRVLNIQPNYWGIPFVSYMGTLGVRLFFTLSGFLITYLLFVEKEVKGTISIKKYYIRRILRIWPLYYLIVIIAFLIIPNLFPGISLPHGTTHTHKLFWDSLNFLLYIFFLPNFALCLMGIVPFAAHTWSIGTEEQFYLVWPVLMKRFHNKFMLLISVIAVYLTIKLALSFLPVKRPFEILKSFWAYLSIDNMAIGGIFALIVYERTGIFAKVRNIIFNRYLQVFVIVLTIVLIGIGFQIPILALDYDFFCILFGIIIANFAANERRVANLEIPVLNYLGKISYGLYMYHPLVITICIKGLTRYWHYSDFWGYLLSISGTILISAFSYRYFEQTFIRKKKRFSTVISGDNTDEHESHPTGHVN
jgi:peptidoglycan/LPS O-acetylase OafA/YrhL